MRTKLPNIVLFRNKTSMTAEKFLIDSLTLFLAYGYKNLYFKTDNSEILVTEQSQHSTKFNNHSQIQAILKQNSRINHANSEKTRTSRTLLASLQYNQFSVFNIEDNQELIAKTDKSNGNIIVMDFKDYKFDEPLVVKQFLNCNIVQTQKINFVDLEIFSNYLSFVSVKRLDSILTVESVVIVREKSKHKRSVTHIDISKEGTESLDSFYPLGIKMISNFTSHNDKVFDLLINQSLHVPSSTKHKKHKHRPAALSVDMQQLSIQAAEPAPATTHAFSNSVVPSSHSSHAASSQTSSLWAEKITQEKKSAQTQCCVIL